MKFLLSLLIILITSQVCNAQILKRITNDIKNEAEHKIRSKTRQKVNQGIDSILAPSQKTEKKVQRKRQVILPEPLRLHLQVHHHPEVERRRESERDSCNYQFLQMKFSKEVQWLLQDPVLNMIN